MFCVSGSKIDPHEIEAGQKRGGISPRVPLVDAGEPRRVLTNSWGFSHGRHGNGSCLPVLVSGAPGPETYISCMVETFRGIPVMKRVKAPAQS